MPEIQCRGCGRPLPDGARFCSECKTLRNATSTCVACCAPIHPDAGKCTVCGSYQGIRRWFDFGAPTLSAASAFISVIALSIGVLSTVATPRSSTSAAIAGATNEHILIGLVNSGNAASVVRDVRITVDRDVVTIDRMWPHKEDEARRLLKGKDSSVLRYNVGSVTRSASAPGDRFWATYGDTPVHLSGTAVESDGKRTTLNDTATLATIRALVEEKCNNCKE
jgi:hypothetical protein